MWVITYKGKAATIDKLCKVNFGAHPDRYIFDEEDYLARSTKAKTKELFLYYFGFTWKERAKGIDVEKGTLGEKK